MEYEVISEWLDEFLLSRESDIVPWPPITSDSWKGVCFLGLSLLGFFTLAISIPPVSFISLI